MLTRLPNPEVQIVRRFGAYTSGQVMLYDTDRRLAFNGGITGSRGHEGNNKGRQAITDWIDTGHAERASTFCLRMSAPI